MVATPTVSIANVTPSSFSSQYGTYYPSMVLKADAGSASGQAYTWYAIE